MQNPSFTKIIGTFNLINISTFLIPKHNKFLLFQTNSNCFIVTFFKICSVAFFRQRYFTSNYFHFEGFTIIHIVILSFLQAKMKIDIQALYESLLVGSCPCHGFTKVEGHTGGFYHIVCRHGVWVYYLQIITTPVLSTINISPFFKLSYLEAVRHEIPSRSCLIQFFCFQVTAASKFLTLQESVRDPADLYLSFKHYPLLFICDTPCGFVRHMDCRDPETTGHLWGSFGGCLEEPSLEKMPTKVHY